jgi:hypothetical protein
VSEGREYHLPSMIICEGPEDVILFQTIARNLGKRLHIEHTGHSRRAAGGNTKFSGKLLGLRIANGFEKVRHLLIVTDSDDDPVGSFAAIQAQIDRAGFGPAPERPFEKRGSGPSVTIVMIPPDGGAGDLEAICSEVAKAVHPNAASEVDRAMVFLEKTEWSASRRRKAWLRVFLAANHADPFVPLGTAVDDRGARALFPIDHACFARLRETVNQLP